MQYHIQVRKTHQARLHHALDNINSLRQYFVKIAHESQDI